MLCQVICNNLAVKSWSWTFTTIDAMDVLTHLKTDPCEVRDLLTRPIIAGSVGLTG